MKPNLFQFATKELSQDAILCWLASWGDPRYKDSDKLLHSLGQNVLSLFFEKHAKKLPESLKSVEVKRQYRNIDILLILNNTISVCIEDKVGSTEHSNQLQRYLEILKTEPFSKDGIVPIYVQTGDQGSYKEVRDAGYQIVQRPELLRILESYSNQGGSNSIVSDFHEHLAQLEMKVQSFKDRPPSDWDEYAWKGFYSELQKRLNEGVWEYVPNHSGGFHGYWLPSQIAGDSEVYLQIEEEFLCFKILVHDADKRNKERDKWLNHILIAAQNSNLNVTRPRKLGSGKTMTVAELDNDYRIVNKEGVLDLEKTIQMLRLASDILDRATSTA